MKHRLRYIATALTVIGLTACGDLLEFSGTTSMPYQITLDRHEVYLMQGDEVQLTATFDPDTVRNQAIYWMSNDVNVASFEDGRLIAVSNGETTVTAISIELQCYDTCHVVVGGNWYVDTRNYAYDMVVNADITIDGQPVGDSTHFVGAFIGDELRGMGVTRQVHGQAYTELRVYSALNPFYTDESLTAQDPLYPDDVPQDPEKFVIRVYDRLNYLMYETPDSIVFDGETLGYPSNLYRIEF